MLGPDDYEVKRYAPADGTVWYHVLYGHVPGHQMDFIYRPETPHGRLKTQHWGELQPIIRHLKPAPGMGLAFAICNLSAHDTQHRAGNGGLAIVLEIPVRVVSDHAGRQGSVFSHAIMTTHQQLSAGYLTDAAQRFTRLFISDGSDWYERYYENGILEGTALIPEYLAAFTDLPTPSQAAPLRRWKLLGDALRHNLILIRRRTEPSQLGEIIGCAARIAALLYHARVRWTAIAEGMYAEHKAWIDADPNELSIRFVNESEGARAPEGTLVVDLAEVPKEEDELAFWLGLRPQKAEVRIGSGPNTRVTEHVESSRAAPLAAFARALEPEGSLTGSSALPLLTAASAQSWEETNSIVGGDELPRLSKEEEPSAAHGPASSTQAKALTERRPPPTIDPCTTGSNATEPQPSGPDIKTVPVFRPIVGRIIHLSISVIALVTLLFVPGGRRPNVLLSPPDIVPVDVNESHVQAPQTVSQLTLTGVDRTGPRRPPTAIGPQPTISSTGNESVKSTVIAARPKSQQGRNDPTTRIRVATSTPPINAEVEIQTLTSRIVAAEGDMDRQLSIFRTEIKRHMDIATKCKGAGEKSKRTGLLIEEILIKGRKIIDADSISIERSGRIIRILANNSTYHEDVIEKSAWLRTHEATACWTK